jgi:hypothetical protein
LADEAEQRQVDQEAPEHVEQEAPVAVVRAPHLQNAVGKNLGEKGELKIIFKNIFCCSLRHKFRSQKLSEINDDLKFIKKHSPD